MPTSSRPHRSPSNSPTPPTSPPSSANLPPRDENLAKRIGKLAVKAIGGLTTLLAQTLRKLSSWAFSFFSNTTNAAGQNPSPSSPNRNGDPQDRSNFAQRSSESISRNFESGDNSTSPREGDSNSSTTRASSSSNLGPTTELVLLRNLTPRVTTAAQPFLSSITPADREPPMEQADNLAASQEQSASSNLEEETNDDIQQTAIDNASTEESSSSVDAQRRVPDSLSIALPNQSPGQINSHVTGQNEDVTDHAGPSTEIAALASEPNNFISLDSSDALLLNTTTIESDSVQEASVEQPTALFPATLIVPYHTGGSTSSLPVQESEDSDSEIASASLPQTSSEVDGFQAVQSVLPLPQTTAAESQFPLTLAGSISCRLHSCLQALILKDHMGISPTGEINAPGNSQAADLRNQFPLICQLLSKRNLDTNNHSDILATFVGEMRKGLHSENTELKEIFTLLNYYQFSGLQLLPFAKQILRNEFQIDDNMSFAAQLENTANLIANPTLFQKIRAAPFKSLLTVTRKICSKINWMDAATYNPPFLAGSMLFQRKAGLDDVKCCYQLRQATPTSEFFKFSEITKFIKVIEITIEYAAFVSKAKALNKKILYSNHQGQSPDEKRRVKVLKEFETKNENFFLISLPVLNEVEDSSIQSKDTFCSYLTELIVNIDLREIHGFYFPNKPNYNLYNNSEEATEPAISNEFIEQRTRLWVDYLKENLITEEEVHFNGENLSSSETAHEQSRIQKNRVMYLTLLQSLLRRDIIHHCKIDFCNNTCKDGIDRGAIHLFFDIYWSMLMNGQENDRLAQENLITSTVFPAYFAKNQAILPDRLDIILAFAQKFDSLSDEAKSNLKANWKNCSMVEKAQFHFANNEQEVSGVFHYDVGALQKIRFNNDRVRIQKHNWNQFLTDLHRFGVANVTLFDRLLVTSQQENEEIAKRHYKFENMGNLTTQILNNPKTQILYNAMNSLRQPGGVLSDCSEDQFVYGLSWLAVLLTQASTATFAKLVEEMSNQNCPGSGLRGTVEGTRTWELKWADENSRETFIFEFNTQYRTSNNFEDPSRMVRHSLASIKAQINTRNFFMQGDTPQFALEWMIGKKPTNVE